MPAGEAIVVFEYWRMGIAHSDTIQALFCSSTKLRLQSVPALNEIPSFGATAGKKSPLKSGRPLTSCFVHLQVASTVGDESTVSTIPSRFSPATLFKANYYAHV